MIAVKFHGLTCSGTIYIDERAFGRRWVGYENRNVISWIKWMSGYLGGRTIDMWLGSRSISFNRSGKRRIAR